MYLFILLKETIRYEFSQMQNDWFDNNRRTSKFQGFVSLDEGMQHGGLRHSTGSGIGHLKCGLPYTLPPKAPAIANISTRNLKNIFKGVFIMTKLSLQIKIKWINKLWVVCLTMCKPYLFIGKNPLKYHNKIYLDFNNLQYLIFFNKLGMFCILIGYNFWWYLLEIIFYFLLSWLHEFFFSLH